MTPDSENGSSIGVISEIDGVPVSDIDKRMRKEWVEQLCEQIRELDGIIECNVNDATQTFQDVELLATVEAQSNDGVVSIPVNLRRLSQELRNIVENDKYASINALATQITSPTKKADGYDSNLYYINVFYP